MDRVEENRAFGGWVGGFEEIDDGRGVVFVVDARKESEFGTWFGVLDRPPLVGNVFLGWLVEDFHYWCGGSRED